MSENAGKFTGKAEVYSKYRPDYAEEFIDYLIEYNSLKDKSIIADIGSGTGIFSRQLLEKGLKVKAVEPNSDMRKEAEESLGTFPGFTSVNGSAEYTVLEEKSIDLVTAAQAFHWFDKEKFKAECRRILKPGSKVALVWNSRVTDDPMVIECGEAMKKLCPLFKGFSGGIDEDAGVFDSFFKDGKYEFCDFRHDLKYDLGGFIGRNLSASYAPKEADMNRSEFIEAMAKIYNKYSRDGFILMPNTTRSYIGKV